MCFSISQEILWSTIGLYVKLIGIATNFIYHWLCKFQSFYLLIKISFKTSKNICVCVYKHTHTYIVYVFVYIFWKQASIFPTSKKNCLTLLHEYCIFLNLKKRISLPCPFQGLHNVVIHYRNHPSKWTRKARINYWVMEYLCQD